MLDVHLPTVHPIQWNDKEIYLVGTAHVSAESVRDVQQTIDLVQPNTVCVELCPKRYQTLVKKDIWKQMDIVQIIHEKKAMLLLAQLLLSSFYRRLGEQLGIQPGAEMIAGIDKANELKCELVLADRDVEITLRRVWGYLGFWNKIKLLSELVMGLFAQEQLNPNLIEELKKQDQLEVAMQALSEAFPEIKHRLLDERDLYLARKIRNAPGTKIVAAVGAGHVAGIKKHIAEDYDMDPLLELPRESKIGSIIGWSIPILLVIFLILGFHQGGLSNSLTSIGIWILVTGSLSALGALLALAHPLTIISAFVAAPITTLHPMLAAGWIAGLVEAWIHRPTVEDFENLKQATTSFKGFWKNPVTKILLVVALSNLGSSLGMFLSSAWIAARSL